jgi:uncharacterized protein involved in type VI secretion and phage assembly
MTKRYYGIYRGTVANNIDPMQLGRIMAIVPDVGAATPLTWAMPCVPLAGEQMGTFMVPQIGAGVWVQFEGGEPDRPVWTGGWWSAASDVPTLAVAGAPGDIVLQTRLQNAVTIRDLPGPAGGITLKSATGATIIVNDAGITIENGKGASLTMVGPAVTINNGALVVV